jgi:hypothetical protein
MLHTHLYVNDVSSEGQAGEAWKTSNKIFPGIGDYLTGKYLHTLH